MENLKHTKDWQLTPMLNVSNIEGKTLFTSQANFSHEQTKEYMKLAASAPDLLEALIEMYKMLDEIPACSSYRPTEDHKKTLNKITNAINKATK